MEGLLVRGMGSKRTNLMITKQLGKSMILEA